MKGKRIIIAHNWNKTTFSAQSVLLAEELSENNDVLFISQQRLPAGTFTINNRLTVVQWPNKKPNKLKDFLFIRKHIRSFKPDITIAHFTAITFVTIAAWLARVPVRIAWYHTVSETVNADFNISSSKAFLQRTFRSYIYKLTTHIVAVSKAAAQDLHRVFKVPQQKISCIYNAVQSNNTGAIQTDEHLIRFLGRYHASKGVDVLIEAIPLVLKEHPSTIFELTGNGDFSSYQQQALQKGITANVIFNGPIAYHDVATYMSKAYFTVVPSRHEAFGMIVIESFSAGTPVVGSNTGGIAEIIHHNKNGLLVTPNDHVALAAAINLLLEQPALRTKLAAQALSDYRNHYSIDVYLQQVINLLQTSLV